MDKADVVHIWNIYTMEYYSAIKKNERMPFAATWMDQQIITLSEVSQKRRQIPYDITYMWNLKYNTNEPIYETKPDKQRTDLWLPRGEEVWERDEVGVWDQQMQTVIYRMDKQGPTVQHRELYSISCDKPQWKRI